MNFTFNSLRRFSLSSKTMKKIQPSTKTKSVSSHQWLSRQLSDPFIEKAKKLNYRCRSAFKLLEIDDRFKIFQPGHIVVDCGAAPGSWTQVAVQRVNADSSQEGAPQGIVVAIDRQLIHPIEGAKIFGHSDFTDKTTQEKLLQFLDGRKVDAVISDMAPKAAGIKELDDENIIHLCYEALKFALDVSDKGASVLVKMWQCGYTKTLETEIGRFYNSVKTVKPASSRSNSAEIFLLGRDFKGVKNS